MKFWRLFFNPDMQNVFSSCTGYSLFQSGCKTPLSRYKPLHFFLTYQQKRMQASLAQVAANLDQQFRYLYFVQYLDFCVSCVCVSSSLGADSWNGTAQGSRKIQKILDNKRQYGSVSGRVKQHMSKWPLQ